MCQHPRCGQPADWIGKGQPFVKIDLCERHKVSYASHNPEMKWTNKSEAMDELSSVMKDVFG